LLFLAGDNARLLDVIEEFVTGRLPAPDADRVLATVLFTDWSARPSSWRVPVTATGVSSWPPTTRSCERSSPASGAARSRSPATASWPPSTDRGARPAARRRSKLALRGAGLLAIRRARARSSSEATTSPGSRSISERGSRRSRTREKCSCHRQAGEGSNLQPPDPKTFLSVFADMCEPPLRLIP
jgi:hypothetical protein